MSKIRLEFNREESYVLLVATECIRQLFCEEDGGIPLVTALRSAAGNREYTDLGVTFSSFDDLRSLTVRVSADDRWPKEGRVFLKADEPNLDDLHFDFRLEGNPANPKVHFTRLSSGSGN